MVSTGIKSFDQSAELTQRWLRELSRELNWDGDLRRSYHALRAVLHALRDRLPVAEAADLGAQLPMLVRGFYYEGWRPQVKARRCRFDDFIRGLTRQFPSSEPEEIELIVRAVCRLLEEHISAGEIRDVKSALPRRLQAFWD